MVNWNPIVQETEGVEENTATDTSLGSGVRFAIGMARAHYLFLAPLVMLTIPSQALLGLNTPFMILLILAGLGGNFLGNRKLSTLVSLCLLCFLIWGRVAVDLLKTGPPDSAVLLAEFGVAVFLMEINLVVLTFDRFHSEIRKKDDPVFKILEARLAVWLKNQLSRQGKIAIGSLGLSLVLLPLAGLTSISFGELPLTGALLLAAIVALLFLVTYQREPDNN